MADVGFPLVAGSEGDSLVAMLRRPIALTSLVAELQALGTWASVVAVSGLSSCGFWVLEHRLKCCGAGASLLHGLWRRQWHPTLVLLPGKSHGHRSLVGLQSMGSLGVGLD